MTLTAQELWNDKSFLETRYNQQVVYLRKLELRDNLIVERKRELFDSASGVLKRFEDRLKELRGDGEREFDGIFEKNSK